MRQSLVPVIFNTHEPRIRYFQGILTRSDKPAVQNEFLLSIENPYGAELHHDIAIGSPMDRARIKDAMIKSHAILMCEYNPDFISAVHCFSICNCSGYSDAALIEVFYEAFRDFMLPLQSDMLSNGYFQPYSNTWNTICHDIDYLSAHLGQNNESNACATEYLLLTSLKNIRTIMISRARR